MKKKLSLQRHQEKCNWRHPPGNEIYSTSPPSYSSSLSSECGQSENASNGAGTEIFGRDIAVQTLSMFEVDGRKSKIYCQSRGAQRTIQWDTFRRKSVQPRIIT
eukprot:TRINITY_DN13296_c0_g1_i3.p1 TRINITY_DN13296_c0_g1~~TRINITY_DN13296_c0_g1_i3.p1  ORF type:complete len:104 (-),score=11.81 TRINITY_DN13296_c0_g1_i3:24-335(-)